MYIFFFLIIFYYFRNRILSSGLNKDYTEHSFSMLRHMEQFATTISCRRYLILSYFDENVKHPTQPRNDCCDICQRQLDLGLDTTNKPGSNKVILKNNNLI